MNTITVIANETLYELPADGTINRNAEHAFTRGQCHAFALAMHRLTGWQLIGLFEDKWEWRDYLEGVDTPGHVVVQSPDGHYVDVTGTNALEEWRGYYPDADPKPLTEKEVMELSTINYGEPDVESATLFANWMINNRLTGPMQFRIPFKG